MPYFRYNTIKYPTDTMKFLSKISLLFLFVFAIAFTGCEKDVLLPAASGVAKDGTAPLDNGGDGLTIVGGNSDEVIITTVTDGGDDEDLDGDPGDGVTDGGDDEDYDSEDKDEGITGGTGGGSGGSGGGPGGPTSTTTGD